MAVSFGLSPKASFKIFVRLPFRHPARVVLAHRLFIIAEQVGDIRNRHTPLQEDARQRVPETVRRGGRRKIVIAARCAIGSCGQAAQARIGPKAEAAHVLLRMGSYS